MKISRYFWLLRVILLSSLVCAYPINASAQDEVAAFGSAPLIEGDEDRFFRQIDDMIIEMEGGLGTLSVRPKRATLWADGVLPIAFDSSFTQSDQRTFYEACNWWTDVARINCVPHTNENDYIIVRGSNSNSSFVGRIGGGQTLNLFNKNIKGIIVHELAHALGFSHQHNSPERDQFVRVNFGNIQSGTEHNFSIIPNAIVMGEYDYCSIMHYSVLAFSKNGQPTIDLLGTPSCRVGQRQFISEQDKLGAIEAYGPSGTPNSLLDVPNLIGRYSGYNGPSNVFQEFGFRTRVIARFDDGKPVDNFVAINGFNTSCDTRITDQFPRPTSETGLRAPFEHTISITLSRTCGPIDVGPNPNPDCDSGRLNCRTP